MRNCRRFAWLAAFLALGPAPRLVAAPETIAPPLRAELVKALEARRAQVGDSLLARALAEWKSPECGLRRGAILQGRIVSRSTRLKTSPISELGVLFDSGQCGGREMKPLPLTVAALLVPSATERSNLYQGEPSQPLSEAVGLKLSGGMRSLSTAADTVFLEPRRPEPPKAVMPGQVVGLKTVKLSVGRGRRAARSYRIPNTTCASKLERSSS